MPDDRTLFGHPSFKTAVGTALAYGIILVMFFVLLFLIPYGVFVRI